MNSLKGIAVCAASVELCFLVTFALMLVNVPSAAFSTRLTLLTTLATLTCFWVLACVVCCLLLLWVERLS